MTLSYDYAIEADPDGYDITEVVVEPGGNEPEIVVAEHYGNTSGTTTVVLTQNSFGGLPTGPGIIRIVFHVYSDDSNSDEDGGYPTACGHTRIDNVRLTGAISHFADFEAGNNGWEAAPDSARVSNDQTNIRSLSDLPPVNSPVACALADSVLVFTKPSGTIGYEIENLAISPWIDLKAGNDVGRDHRFVSYSAYTDFNYFEEYVPNMGPRGTMLAVQYFPYPPDCTGPVTQSPWIFDDHLYIEPPKSCTPPGAPKIRDLTALIPPTAQQVRIAIGPLAFCNLACPQDHITPYFDNIRFGVWGQATSGVGPPSGFALELGPASPNPSSGPVTIPFTVERAGERVRVEIFDVVGRKIRTLVDGVEAAGANAVSWDGSNESGERVTAGMYFYRLTLGLRERTRSLVITR